MHVATETRAQVRRDRLLRLRDVEDLTGLKKSTIYLKMKRSEFPHCVQITTRCVAWPESAVLQWVQDQIASAAGQRLPAAWVPKRRGDGPTTV